MMHSPLPWKASHRAVCRDGIVKPLASAQTPEDAAFIVRAANSHAQLLAACEAAVELYELIIGDWPEIDPDKELTPELSELKAAIAAATK